MKKALSLVLACLLLLLSAACADDSALDPRNPVTLTLWHVYGEQADSPMNRLIEDFNRTVGMETGIVINVTLISNTAQIGQKLLDAQAEMPGVPHMPDLFFCHSSNAAELGVSNLLNWKDAFSEEELGTYVPAFVEDGMVDDVLAVFPVSKSTHVLYLSGTQYDRFAQSSGVTYEQLSTWDGFFDVAAAYHAQTGKPFCALDYLLRCVELNAISHGARAENLYTADGWYNFDNDFLKNSWMEFAEAIAKGHLVVSDLYSNTMVMTGDVIAGIGSSASILYYNDVITYPDNTSEPMDLRVVPLPSPENGIRLMTLAGVGLCARKTTEQKAEAAAIFARYLTESTRNLAFVASTGYMPVRQDAFESIKTFAFDSPAYKNLYETLFTINETASLVKEPSFALYYAKVNALYGKIRGIQASLSARHAAGEDATALAEELWALFRSVT